MQDVESGCLAFVEPNDDAVYTMIVESLEEFFSVGYTDGLSIAGTS